MSSAASTTDLGGTIGFRLSCIRRGSLATVSRYKPLSLPGQVSSGSTPSRREAPYSRRWQNISIWFRCPHSTYDHIHEKVRDPVRSPLVKLVRACESPISSWVGGQRIPGVVCWFLETLKVSHPDFWHSACLAGLSGPCSGPAAQEPLCGAGRIDPSRDLHRTVLLT